MSLQSSVRVPCFSGEVIYCFSALCVIVKFFISPYHIQTPGRPAGYTGGWVQMAEQEIWIVVASEEVIVASQLYNVADVQFTVE